MAAGDVSRTHERVERPSADFEANEFPTAEKYEDYLKGRKTTGLGEINQAQTDKRLTAQWDAPTEQVLAQLGQISEFVLVRPRDRVALLRRFASVQDSSIVDKYVIVLLNSASGEHKEVDDLAFDVRHYIQQNLDALLLTIGTSWKRKVRLEATVAAGLIGVGALFFTQVDPFVKLSAILTSTVFGGFFAWFTRDIVASVEKWRS